MLYILLFKAIDLWYTHAGFGMIILLPNMQKKGTSI
ncbi:hypothetical protein AN935_09015 [Bacillus inaquosorum]|nr:hypothetical protein AN935_09015 [Bacillus inaquosorum]